MATQATTVGATAITVFKQRIHRRTWGAHRPLYQLLASEDISAARVGNEARMIKVKNEFGKAEAYKWPISTSAPGTTASFAPGASFSYTNIFNQVFGTVSPKFYRTIGAVPTSLVDVTWPAKDNENAINYVARLLDDLRKDNVDTIARHLVQTAPGANDIETLVGTGTASGVLGDGLTVGKQTIYGIDTAVETSLRSVVFDLAGARLTLARMAKDIRDIRRTRQASLDVVIMGSGVHDLLTQEARATNQPYFDIVDVFGTDPEEETPRLYLETSFSVLKNEGAVLIVDTDLDVTAPGRAIGISLGEISLDAGTVNNLRTAGPKDVSIEDGADQTRILIRSDHMLTVYDRSKFIIWNNCQTS